MSMHGEEKGYTVLGVAFFLPFDIVNGADSAVRESLCEFLLGFYRQGILNT